MEGYNKVKIYGSDESVVTLNDLAEFIGNSGGGGQQGEKGDSAYQVAINNGYVGTQEEWLESLVGSDGAKGDQGVQGERGQQGVQGVQGERGQTGAQGIQGVKGADGAKGDKGDKGSDGATGLVWRGEYDDTATYLKDDAVSFDGATYFSLTETTGVPPLPENDDWALMASHGQRGEKGDKGDKGDVGANGVQGIQGAQGIQGIQGEQGEKGDRGVDGVFDIDDITQPQLEELHEKLTELNEYQVWSYQSYLANGQSCRFKVADLNLDLSISRTGGATIVYKFYPNDSSKEARYYVNRLSNYDLTAWESTVTLSYQAQVITSSGFFLDQSGYLAGREQTLIQVIDPTTNIWYSIEFIGLGEGTMFIDVKKRVNQNRVVIPAS